MKKKYLIPVLALLLGCTSDIEKKKLDLRIDHLEADLKRIKFENDSLKKELQLLENKSSVVFTPEIDSLNNPEKFILESLERNQELIPLKSVLGGTMRFVDTEILNERFIWAAYEDGHVGGEAIFQYKLTKTDSIEFHLISKIKN
ncbi:hypothetical protein DET49_108130 [Salegentibacter sp. 24]|uniref:hypothetical protein n=1 Tax=Salegentibacter sp. 24 TaxID=2183986 RepID=UPI00105D1F0C|nr:hypothetical protein [Salegentibacter sp. 24]TDN88806.1 hypothetical protein DET49_108130 [Salegentibacter sp. 24]